MSYSGIPTISTALEEMAQYDYGHSMVSGVSEVSGSKWVDRLAGRLRSRSHANNGVAGYTAAQVAQKAMQAWTPGTKGLVPVMGIFNDVQFYTTDTAGPATTATSLRALFAFLTCGVAYGHLSTSFAYTGGGWSTVSQAWSYLGGNRRTNAPGDSVDIAWNGDICYLLGQSFATTTGGLVTVTRPGDGATVTTFRTDGMAAGLTANSGTTPSVVKFSGYGAGDHTLRLTLTSGAAFIVNAVLIPGPYPPAICLVREGPVQVYFAGYSGSTNGGATAGNAALASLYNPAADALLAEFPTLVMTPSIGPPGWDAATCASADGLHPNEKGSGLYADAAQRALAGLGWRDGMNNLASVATFGQPSPSFYLGSPAAPGQVAGVTGTITVTTVALAWGAPVNNGSTITDYLIEYKLSSSGTWGAWSHTASPATNVTITGLTTGSPYDFRISAINGIGTGTASSVFTTTPAAPTILVSDDFNRADTTTGLGTAVLGGAWSATAEMRILSNQATTAGVGGETTPVLNAGAANCTVQATYQGTGGTGSDAGLVGRWSDNNNYWCAWAFGNAASDWMHWAILRKAGGAFTFPAVSTVTKATGQVVQLLFTGSTITLNVDGVVAATVTDTFNQSATYAGFRAGMPGSATNVWDDLVVTG